MRLFYLLAIAGAVLASPPRLHAQSAPAPTSEAVAAIAATQATADTSVSISTAPSGLPAVAAPPRTLRAYWHVFVAFAVAWALLFGYTIVLARRYGALAREVRRMEGSRS